MSFKKSLPALTLALAVMFVLAAWPTSAQQPGQRIVLVNGDRVTSETQIGQAVRARITAAATDWQQRVETAQTELNTLVQNRSQQQLTLNADALAALNAQIEEKQVELDRIRQDAQRVLERMQNEAIDEVNQQLIPALEAMAGAEGYALVLDTRLAQIGGLLYFSDTLDVTDDFIARVNAASNAQ